MIHHASPDFWAAYHSLPEAIRSLADKAFESLKADPRHPAVQVKKAGRFWSARVAGGILDKYNLVDDLDLR